MNILKKISLPKDLSPEEVGAALPERFGTKTEILAKINKTRAALGEKPYRFIPLLMNHLRNLDARLIALTRMGIAIECNGLYRRKPDLSEYKPK